MEKEKPARQIWSRFTHWLRTKGLVTFGVIGTILIMASFFYIAIYAASMTGVAIATGVDAAGMMLTLADKIVLGILGTLYAGLFAFTGWVGGIWFGTAVINKAVDNMSMDEYQEFREKKSTKVISKIIRCQFGAPEIQINRRDDEDKEPAVVSS